MLEQHVVHALCQGVAKNASLVVATQLLDMLTILNFAVRFPMKTQRS